MVKWDAPNEPKELTNGKTYDNWGKWIFIARSILEGPMDNTGRKLLQTGVRDAPNQPNLP